jgi:hypothetical protein
MADATIRLLFRALAISCLLTAGGCDLLTESLPRALEGKYAATWTYTAFGPGGARFGAALVCEGALRIDEASDSVVRGSYTIPETEQCNVASGTLTGVVRRDGGLELDAGSVDLWFGACLTAGVDLAFNGIVDDGEITLSTRSPVQCDELPISSVQTDLSARKR